jgi:hypothetical protein
MSPSADEVRKRERLATAVGALRRNLDSSEQERRRLPLGLEHEHVIAEQLADALQAGLDTTVKLASYQWVTSEWTQYATEAVASSSILRSTVRDRPGIWTPHEALVADYDARAGAEL